MNGSIPLSYRFLLKHGQTWHTGKHVIDAMYSEKQECFKNALWYALNNNLDYVEGWAVSGDLPPFEHAWCVDSMNNIHDPTWDNGHDYFGAIFNPEYILFHVTKSSCYGIFGNVWHLNNMEELMDYLEKGLSIRWKSRN